MRKRVVECVLGGVTLFCPSGGKVCLLYFLVTALVVLLDVEADLSTTEQTVELEIFPGLIPLCSLLFSLGILAVTLVEGEENQCI